MKYFSRQLSCKRKVALQERNAKLEGFPQLLHWFRIVDIRKEVMEVRAAHSLMEKEGAFPRDLWVLDLTPQPGHPTAVPSGCPSAVGTFPMSPSVSSCHVLGSQRQSPLQGKGNSVMQLMALHVPRQGWVFLVLTDVELNLGVPKTVEKVEIKLKFLQVFLEVPMGNGWFGSMT